MATIKFGIHNTKATIPNRERKRYFDLLNGFSFIFPGFILSILIIEKKNFLG
jgi:hypothetical protein